MASVKLVSIPLSEEKLLCSICLHVFTEPVNTPCGHTYCRACITEHWDKNVSCECPLCNKAFYRRPLVFVNNLLSDMADELRRCKRLKSTYSVDHEPPKPDEVSCDVCSVEAKRKALKSCLLCLTSYCENHLERHHTVPALKRHTLIDPLKYLEDYTCKTHNRPLKLFCVTDRMCVCDFCPELGHTSHT